MKNHPAPPDSTWRMVTMTTTKTSPRHRVRDRIIYSPPTTDRRRIDPDRVRSEEQKEGSIGIRSHHIPSPTTTPRVSIVRFYVDSDVSVLSRQSISVRKEADLLDRTVDSQYDHHGGDR